MKLSLERFYAAEAAMKKGAFAKVDIEEALTKSTRDPSASLSLPVKQLKRIEFNAISNIEAEGSKVRANQTKQNCMQLGNTIWPL